MSTYRTSIPAVAVLLLSLQALPAQAQPPALFYTDLDSGPSSGGEHGLGAYITLYGKHFGSTQGSSSVYVGEGRAAGYSLWSDTKIVIQPGAGVTSGDIVVRTPAGRSNGVPFSVRPGSIFFVSTKGSDGSSGSFSSPWKTLLKARDTMQPGDITYAMDGVKQTEDDGQGWNAAILLRNGGKPGLPLAIVAYPGATVQVGAVGGPGNGIRSTGKGNGYWVFAGLTLRGEAAVNAWDGNGWRVIANDISCPNGDGAAGCFGASQSSHVKFLGNNVHDAGVQKASALFHGVYFSTDSNYIEVGWNTIANIRGGRGLHFHSSQMGSGGPEDKTGYNMYALSIHDNVIHDIQCDGIILATVDPSKGKVEILGNVIYNAGKGPANAENTGNWACIYASGSTNKGDAGGGVIDVRNNTLYNCGTFANPPWVGANAAVMNGEGNPNLHFRLRNNIIFAAKGVPYLVGKELMRGSNNLFYGNGAAPSSNHIQNSIESDPLFVNPGQADFHLLEASPARGAGLPPPKSALDKDGILRDSGVDLGAYPYQPQAAAQGAAMRSRK